MSSPVSSSPAPLDFAFDVEQHATPTTNNTSPEPEMSTAASSPPAHELSEYSYACSEVAESLGDTDHLSTKEESAAATPITMNETETERRLARLQFLLQRSAVYSGILKTRMDEEKARQAKLQAQKRQAEKAGRKRVRPDAHPSPKGKRKKGTNGEIVAVDGAEVDGHGETPIFQQPALVTGARLKPYQLEGLQWMVSLDQNGISGILADEMGLGKTLEAIAFSAYLREHDNFKPFLVVCPLSVLLNWADEYKKFAPDIPVCVYHGTPAERAELRRTVMALPGTRRSAEKHTTSRNSKPGKRKTGRPSKTKPKEVDESSARRSKRPHKQTTKAKATPRKSTIVIDSEDEVMEVDEETDTAKSKEEEGEYTSSFPVVLTTYEMIIKDRAHLAHYDWGYIVVDEGHRLKNFDCKLMKEIKKYTSAGRMILTGTPLQNNLSELWSLLNFILPDIFDDIDTFQEWFNLPELQSSLPTSQSAQIISSLHAILKPFLLRRLKVDVEMNLPPKKEYVLYAPLTTRQKEAYDRVLHGGLREWLIQGGTGGIHIVKDSDEMEEDDSEQKVEEEVKDRQGVEDDTDGSKEAGKKRVSSRLTKGRRKSYAVDGDDDEYFKMLERGNLDKRGVKVVRSKAEEAEESRIGREHQARAKVKQVNNMKLQNMVMQLRKVCSHPFLFDWPIDPETRDPVLGEELVNASGKMMVLDRLLRELFKRGHKVLLFSQFTTMLDIIEEWAVDYMGWRICRIDGSTKPMDRREEMNRFQTGGDDPEAPHLFLLSTRAGGLGINLVAADTVIFYDQDWNPQMDAQAQDRAHRIGQTRPVLIFRLVSAHTVETKIMQRATEKKKLEALVIAKGKFKTPAAAASTKRETMAEMAASLLRLEGEKIDVVPNTKEGKQGVLSDEDLDVLLDRSPEVFAERGQGWTSGAAQATSDKVVKNLDVEVKHTAIGTGKKAAFAVYEAPAQEGNDALAKIMGEEEAE
ncbi:SNF2 family N-terminal domain-containing protein [Flammula alnicola]|nr:SNF2 family N-terminal domain-containing protein [Flammula alnicola]